MHLIRNVYFTQVLFANIVTSDRSSTHLLIHHFIPSIHVVNFTLKSYYRLKIIEKVAAC